MGMFDVVDILYPIEIPKHVEEKYLVYIKAAFDRNSFQTKDLDCLLDRYYIDKEGILRDFSKRTYAIQWFSQFVYYRIPYSRYVLGTKR